MTNPYAPPQSNVAMEPEVCANAEQVRFGQRLLILALGLNIIGISQAGTPTAAIGPLFALAAFFVGIAGLYQVGKGMKTSIWKRVVVVVLLLLPLINLIVLLVVNSKATKLLRQAGYQVGLLGAKKKAVA